MSVYDPKCLQKLSYMILLCFVWIKELQLYLILFWHPYQTNTQQSQHIYKDIETRILSFQEKYYNVQLMLCELFGSLSGDVQIPIKLFL